MNDKDIKLFAKRFVFGYDYVKTTQTSREPIELETKVIIKGESLDFKNSSLEDIESTLIKQLMSFTRWINDIRDNDAKFSKAQKAEMKRQEKVVKMLKQTIKK